MAGCDPLSCPCAGLQRGPRSVPRQGRLCWLRGSGQSQPRVTALPADPGAQQSQVAELGSLSCPSCPQPGPLAGSTSSGPPRCHPVHPHSPGHAVLAGHHGPLRGPGRSTGNILVPMQLKTIAVPQSPGWAMASPKWALPDVVVAAPPRFGVLLPDPAVLLPAGYWAGPKSRVCLRNRDCRDCPWHSWAGRPCPGIPVLQNCSTGSKALGALAEGSRCSSRAQSLFFF